MNREKIDAKIKEIGDRLGSNYVFDKEGQVCCSPITDVSTLLDLVDELLGGKDSGLIGLGTARANYSRLLAKIDGLEREKEILRDANANQGNEIDRLGFLLRDWLKFAENQGDHCPSFEVPLANLCNRTRKELRNETGEPAAEGDIEALKTLVLDPSTDCLFRCESEAGKVYVVDSSQFAQLFSKKKEA